MAPAWRRLHRDDCIREGVKQRGESESKTTKARKTPLPPPLSPCLLQGAVHAQRSQRP